MSEQRGPTPTDTDADASRTMPIDLSGAGLPDAGPAAGPSDRSDRVSGPGPGDAGSGEPTPGAEAGTPAGPQAATQAGPQGGDHAVHQAALDRAEQEQAAYERAAYEEAVRGSRDSGDQGDPAASTSGAASTDAAGRSAAGTSWTPSADDAEPRATEPSPDRGSERPQPSPTGASPRPSSSVPRTAAGRPPGRGPSRAGGPERVQRASASSSAGGRQRRARLRLTRIDPWSVLLLSLLVSLFLAVVVVVAVVALYAVLEAAGVPDSLNALVAEVTRTPGEAEPEPLLSAGRALRAAGVLAVVDVVLVTALSTLAAVLYNLCASFTGGLDVTLAEDS